MKDTAIATGALILSFFAIALAVGNGVDMLPISTSGSGAGMVVVIDNSTTNGWTSPNVSLNGSRITGDGLLALNLKNDSALNMSGLVAYWSFDEASGTVAHQMNTESGLVNVTNQGNLVNMNTGLNNCTGNCSGWNSSGRIGNGLAFDGVNDYVNAGNDGSLNFTGGVTVSTWVYPVGNNYGIIVKKQSGSVGWRIYRYTDGRFYVGSATNGGDSVSSGVHSGLNIWYYITWVWSGSTNEIYINGQNESVARPNYTTPPPNTVASLNIGGQPIYFNGTIDEVKIWNRALSASEVAVAYNTSMRNISMPVISQEASSGNVIDRVRVNYSNDNSLHNLSLYARQNSTLAWTLVQSNPVNNIWYSTPVRYHAMDFGIQFNGNGSNTTFLRSLQWGDSVFGDTNYYNYTNTTGGGGGVSFNGSAVDLNGSSLYNGTVPTDNLKLNKSLDTASNLTISQNTRANFTVSPPLNKINLLINNTGVQALFVGNGTQFFNGNHVVEIQGTNQLDADYGLAATPLVVTGGSGSIEFWKDISASKVIAFGMATPGNLITDDFVVSGYAGDWLVGWKQMIRTNTTTLRTTVVDFTITNLNGSGNAYVCVDSTGKLYRDSVGCS